MKRPLDALIGAVHPHPIMKIFDDERIAWVRVKDLVLGLVDSEIPACADEDIGAAFDALDNVSEGRLQPEEWWNTLLVVRFREPDPAHALRIEADLRGCRKLVVWPDVPRFFEGLHSNDTSAARLVANDPVRAALDNFVPKRHRPLFEALLAPNRRSREAVTALVEALKSELFDD
jgi:hypothetical protein